MIVGQPKNLMGSLLGTSDEIDFTKRTYYVEGGVCGFASVQLYAKDTQARKFLNWVQGKVKTARPATAATMNTLSVRKDDYNGGVSMSVMAYGQSMQRKQ